MATVELVDFICGGQFLRCSVVGSGEFLKGWWGGFGEVGFLVGWLGDVQFLMGVFCGSGVMSALGAAAE